MGPLERVAQFKAIETTRVPNPPDPQAPGGYYGLQQLRWDPINIADTPCEAYNRLFKLPGSEFSDPEMTWKYEVAPGGIDFLSTKELGKDYKGDLFVGSARGALRGGNLFRLQIEDNRKRGRRLRRQAPEGPRRRQPRQVRDHRERVAALRRELRRHAGHQGRPGRHACSSFLDAGHGLRDPPQVALRLRP